MWKSPAISKDGGNVGKPVFGFPRFPRAVISTAELCVRVASLCPEQASSKLRNVYTPRYTVGVAQDIEFEWDDENIKHLGAHKVTPAEFEYVLTNNAVDLGYELIDDEERYRAVGLTEAGRLLTVVWTPRNGSVRAVTAFPATVADKKAFLEMFG